MIQWEMELTRNKMQKGIVAREPEKLYYYEISSELFLTHGPHHVLSLLDQEKMSRSS